MTRAKSTLRILNQDVLIDVIILTIALSCNGPEKFQFQAFRICSTHFIEFCCQVTNSCLVVS